MKKSKLHLSNIIDQIMKTDKLSMEHHEFHHEKMRLEISSKETLDDQCINLSINGRKEYTKINW